MGSNEDDVGAAFSILASTDASNLPSTDVVDYLILVTGFFDMARKQVFDKRDFDWSLCDNKMVRNVDAICKITSSIIKSATENDYDEYKIEIERKTGCDIYEIFKKLDVITYLCNIKFTNEGCRIIHDDYMSDRTHTNVLERQLRIHGMTNDDLASIQSRWRNKQWSTLEGSGQQFPTLGEVIGWRNTCASCQAHLTPTTYFEIMDNCPHMRCVDCAVDAMKDSDMDYSRLIDTSMAVNVDSVRASSIYK